MDRAIDLAVTYQWSVRPAGNMQVSAQRSRFTIFTTPMYGDAELALFIHEGGHLQDSHWSEWPAIKAMRDGHLYSDSLHAERFA